MSTATPPRRSVEHGLGRGAGAEAVHDDVDAFTVVVLACPVAQWGVPGGQDVDAVRGDGLHVVEQGGVAAGAEDAGAAHGQGVETGAESEGAGDAVDQDGAAGPGAGLAQRGERGTEVAVAGSLEGDAVGQPYEVALRGGHVLGQAAVGVGVEQALPVGPNAK
ncbi:MAG: hypothetical protein ABW212_17310 [Pseudonocardia sediminis]